MQYIESHPKVLEQQKGDKLPEELFEWARRKQLSQAYQWRAGRDIVYFKKLQGKCIPFYLDYQLVKSTDIKDMLESLKGEQLYQIMEDQS
jgi:hypothetical protein